MWETCPLVDLPSAGSMTDFFGTSGDARILELVRNDIGANGVIFGQDGDPYADRFKYFTNVVTNVSRNTTELIRKTSGYIMATNRVIPIQKEEDLYAVPEVMRAHILTMPSIRAHLEKGIINGWDINPGILPREDVAGRLITNGRFTPTYNHDAQPVYKDEIEYVFKSSDPTFSIEELEDIDASRLYIDKFIERQMAPGGDALDPTGFAGGYTIGSVID